MSPLLRASQSRQLLGGLWRWKSSVPVFKELAIWWESETSPPIMIVLHNADWEPVPRVHSPHTCSPWPWENFPERLTLEMRLEGDERGVWGREHVPGEGNS